MERRPSFSLSFLPIVVLVTLQVAVITHFGSDALNGPSQLGLLTAAAVAVFLAVWRCGCNYERLEKALGEAVHQVAVPMVLLLLIGAMGGVWMVSGVVPYLIHAGLHIISPAIFLPTACLLCAIVSLLTGSSWTTIATIGVALLGIGDANGFGQGWIAGAIISGAYFGDKLSPLSDTTILASSSCHVPLFTHINFMLRTTIPSITLSLIIFAVASLLMTTSGAGHVDEYIHGLEQNYCLSHWLLVVPAFTAFLIYKRLPSIVVMSLSALSAVAIGTLVQSEAIDRLTPGNLFMDLVQSLVGETQIQTGNASLDALLCTRGMSGMLNTIWLILCAMIFGGVMTESRMMETFVARLLRMVDSVTSLVSTTILSGLLCNIVVGDQFLSIVLNASLYKDKYKQMNLPRRLLSRSVEDSATVTSALIPWNSCGLTQSTVLGVATYTYLPYCFFNILSPLMSILITALTRKRYFTSIVADEVA